MSPSRAQLSGVPFDRLCELSGLPTPQAEVRFSRRRWRWDWAWPDAKVALEVNGGVWVRGKHSRGAGQLNDFAKWSEGAALGWRVIHTTPDGLESTMLLDQIRRALEGGSRC